MLAMNNWMEDKTPRVHQHHYFFLNHTCKLYVHIINGIKYPATGFGLVVKRIPKNHRYTALTILLYATKSTKHNKSNCTQKLQQIISIWTEALIWLKITTKAGNKIKVETESKEIYQKLLDLIKIETIKSEQQKYPEQNIINFTMYQIINSSFNKHSMSWELIHNHVIHTSDSFMKEIIRHQTLTDLPKH